MKKVILYAGAAVVAYWLYTRYGANVIGSITGRTAQKAAGNNLTGSPQ